MRVNIDTFSEPVYLGSMRKKQKPANSGAMIILWQMSPHEWIFSLPQIGEDVHDRLDEGIEWLDDQPKLAASIFRKLIDDYPEHLDAYHHLALALDVMGKDAEAFEVRERAVKTALEVFPPHFSMEQDRLQWGFLENRPFLRLYQSFGWQLMKRGQVEEALAVSENILVMNPNDNQGVRSLVVGCHFALHEPAGVLSLCRQYPNDMMEHVLYGKALALFQLGRLKPAGKALRAAFQCFPLIALELLKNRHQKPKGANARYIALGSPQQAYLYWKEQGRYWTETPGTVDFLRTCVPGK